jgi:gentisate 1,2-dioxygenase
MKSHHWKWSVLEPILERIGEEIDLGAGGPRRTLRLVSPGLGMGTTPTFWASIQVILPGEIADAHRHSASAFRFVMRGAGATTTVDGEQYPMSEGDLVLTPAWTWHDHEYKGSEPMIWLDVLDISLMQTLHATFFEAYASATQPLADIPDNSARLYGSGLMRPPGPAPVHSANPLLVYPASMARQALESAVGAVSDPVDDVVLEYQNPCGGGSAMPTMAMTLQTLRKGFRGQARRNTGSRLYYVVQGSGATTVGGERFEWGRGDFMTVAPWVWHAHENLSEGDAVLFQVNDLPVLRALGFCREEVRP